MVLGHELAETGYDQYCTIFLASASQLRLYVYAATRVMDPVRVMVFDTVFG